MNPKRISLLLVSIVTFFMVSNLNAQNLTQTVRGQVLDRDTKQPLIGATVLVKNSEPQIRAETDENGFFNLEEVPVGRQSLQCVFWRYEGIGTEDIIVTAAKGVFVKINLSENITTEDNDVLGSYKGQNRPINEMSLVSARSFSVEETQRYPASVNDPSRMASSFAGVRITRDDLTDLSIRGNSPIGVLWRLEGIDIPNPNHFARVGSSGGGISMFSASLLSNSDFVTGNFSAEYGNALAGAFDMHFRAGNDQKAEFTTRIGLIGLDFSAEGPFKKGGSSFLINYRYSTLGILNSLGLRLVGPRTENAFQDLSFNLSFPGKKRKSLFTVFGIGGLSDEISFVRPDTADWRVADDYTQYIFITNMGVLGVTNRILLNDKSYLKTSLAFVANQVAHLDDTFDTQFDFFNIDDEEYIDARISLSTAYNYKFNPTLFLKTGGSYNYILLDLYKRSWNGVQRDTLIDHLGQTQLIQPYLQLRYQPVQALEFVAGAHGYWFTLNNQLALDPRFSMRVYLGKGHSLSAAYGIHSQHLPISNYFYRVSNGDGTFNHPNQNLPFMRAHHALLGYSWYTENDFMIGIEGYFQYQWNLPISEANDSTYGLLNSFRGIYGGALRAEGIGMNYGVDVTIEKFFSKNYFFLASLSAYQSKYRALDQQWYNTSQNYNFSTTITGGKEFDLGKSHVLQINTRLFFSGGNRYIGVDTTASVLANSLVYDYTLNNTEMGPFFVRWDLRLQYRKDFKKLSYALSLDINNVADINNYAGLRFDGVTRSVVYRKQSGILPILAFRLDF